MVFAAGGPPGTVVGAQPAAVAAGLACPGGVGGTVACGFAGGDAGTEDGRALVGGVDDAGACPVTCSGVVTETAVGGMVTATTDVGSSVSAGGGDST